MPNLTNEFGYTQADGYFCPICRKIYYNPAFMPKPRDVMRREPFVIDADKSDDFAGK